MEPKIERTAFNSQRDQIFWHLCGFLIGLWQRQSLLLSEPIRYKKHTTRRAALFESYHLCKYLHLSFLTEAGITLGCAKLVRFVCAVLLSNCQDICGISYGLLSFCKQHMSGSLEWSRLSLLPASHPVHSDLIQLNPQPDAPPPTTLVLSHNRSMSFMKTPGTLETGGSFSQGHCKCAAFSLLQGRQQLPPQPKYHHDPQKREVQVLQTVQGAVAR